MKLILPYCTVEIELPDVLSGLTDCIHTNISISLRVPHEIDNVKVRMPNSQIATIKKFALVEIRGQMLPFIADGSIVRWFTLEE